ncbi:MAG: peptide-methionine (S)-S-oxide reductase MsrA [Betaproteobacteria bacterium]|nr:peptide-methionine (S)-S-oxide reductase MsrA [Betaproteobacteria bacterium]
MKALHGLILLLASALVVPAAAQAPAQKPPAKTKTAQAVFAGGCFWCMEEAYDKVPGVISVVSGYSGGHVKSPTYEQVITGRTGHAEVVLVEYDPAKVSYQKLLDVFWRNIDPTQGNGQFCDFGSQYRSAIFYQDEEQKRLAEASKKALEKSRPFKGDIVTEVSQAAEFFRAEDYHQRYYITNPLSYYFYKAGCGREARLQQLWGPPRK